MEKTCFVGVDVGGTKVAAGLVNAEGEIAAQVRIPMVSSGSAEAGLNAVLLAIAQVAPAGDAGISGIGICAPGPLDPTTGIILNPPNVPCWRNFPLADAIRDIHRVSVKVDNDANAAALAETRWGAGRGHQNVLYATIGTGIGTGEIVGKAADNGDALAREILSETTEMLALWLSNMVDLFDPEIIVIGGGAAALLHTFFDQLRARMPQFAVNPRANEVPIVQARYGADAGIAGGAALCA